jgi:hypothetical protein
MNTLNKLLFLFLMNPSNSMKNKIEPIIILATSAITTSFLLNKKKPIKKRNKNRVIIQTYNTVEKNEGVKNPLIEPILNRPIRSNTLNEAENNNIRPLNYYPLVNQGNLKPVIENNNNNPRHLNHNPVFENNRNLNQARNNYITPLNNLHNGTLINNNNYQEIDESFDESFYTINTILNNNHNENGSNAPRTNEREEEEINNSVFVNQGNLNLLNNNRRPLNYLDQGTLNNDPKIKPESPNEFFDIGNSKNQNEKIESGFFDRSNNQINSRNNYIITSVNPIFNNNNSEIETANFYGSSYRGNSDPLNKTEIETANFYGSSHRGNSDPLNKAEIKKRRLNQVYKIHNMNNDPKIKPLNLDESFYIVNSEDQRKKESNKRLQEIEEEYEKQRKKIKEDFQKRNEENNEKDEIKLKEAIKLNKQTEEEYEIELKEQLDALRLKHKKENEEQFDKFKKKTYEELNEKLEKIEKEKKRDAELERAKLEKEKKREKKEEEEREKDKRKAAEEAEEREKKYQKTINENNKELFEYEKKKEEENKQLFNNEKKKYATYIENRKKEMDQENKEYIEKNKKELDTKLEELNNNMEAKIKQYNQALDSEKKAKIDIKTFEEHNKMFYLLKGNREVILNKYKNKYNDINSCADYEYSKINIEPLVKCNLRNDALNYFSKLIGGYKQTNTLEFEKINQKYKQEFHTMYEILSKIEFNII